jgi:hypothetical protein
MSRLVIVVTLYSPLVVIQSWAALRLRCSTVSALNYGQQHVAVCGQ